MNINQQKTDFTFKAGIYELTCKQGKKIAQYTI